METGNPDQGQPHLIITVRPASFEEMCTAYAKGFRNSVVKSAPEIQRQPSWCIIERGPIDAPQNTVAMPLGEEAVAPAVVHEAGRLMCILRDHPEYGVSAELGMTLHNAGGAQNATFRIAIAGMSPELNVLVAIGTGYALGRFSRADVRKMLETFPFVLAQQHLAERFPAIFSP